ncbi:MAG: hypothetical protein L6R37_007104 [Teloschistes peruensis]|nr:MAG: hypothetical protein L6R37_007104 [Teloschistes peruensis]
MIYDYALMVPGQINPYPTFADKEVNGLAVQCDRPAVALLQTSKQIRAEAQPSLYGKNVWVISWQINPSLPRAVYDNSAHLFRHIALSLDPRDVTENERELLRMKLDMVVLKYNQLSGRVYTPLEKFYLLAWAHRQAFLTLILEKLHLLESIYRHGNLCSIHIDVTEVRNPLTGERREMLEAMADVVDPKIWGTGPPRLLDYENPASRAFVKMVMRDPVCLLLSDRSNDQSDKLCMYVIYWGKGGGLKSPLRK